MPDGKHSMERDVYEDLSATGGLNGFPFEGWFVDAGTPASYIQANQVCISEEKFSSGYAHGGSWFGEGSTNLGEVTGSCIGAGASIGERSVVRGSAILERAEIGASCTIEGSLIGVGAIIPEGSVLQGEIVNHR